MLKSLVGGRMFADAAGSGPPRLIALHGWGRTSADFRGVLSGVGGWAVDLPGFGESPPPPAVWGSEDYADLLAEALDELSGAVLLVGHSFGGRVAVRLASRRPDLVSGLVLSGVPLIRAASSARKSPRAFRLMKSLNRFGLVSDGRLDDARERYGSADYRRAQGIMRHVLVRVVNETYEDDLEKIHCPVELVWGADDTAVPPAVAEQACSILRSCNLVIEPGCSHLLPVERPDAIEAAITRVTHVATESA